MRVYLDLCCLKRPFNDQAQPRIHDDRFLAAARRHASLLKVRVVNPVDLAREVLS